MKKLPLLATTLLLVGCSNNNPAYTPIEWLYGEVSSQVEEEIIFWTCETANCDYNEKYYLESYVITTYFEEIKPIEWICYLKYKHKTLSGKVRQNDIIYGDCDELIYIGE